MNCADELTTTTRAAAHKLGRVSQRVVLLQKVCVISNCVQTTENCVSDVIATKIQRRSVRVCLLAIARRVPHRLTASGWIPRSVLQ